MAEEDATALQAIQAAAREIWDAEEHIESARGRIEDLVTCLKGQCGEDGLVKAAAFLYWDVPAVHSSFIARELLGCSVNALLSRIPHLTHHEFCHDCGGELDVPFTSRTDFKQHSATKDYVCALCWAVHEKANKQRSKQRWLEIAKEEQACASRLQDLKNMPYSEYLKTPEWAQTRKRALHRAYYRCQLCNDGNKTLNVHHRTYERLGQEYARDLIVLCRDCHAKFHDKEAKT